MKEEKINLKKIDERAVVPTYGSYYSAGADLYALLDEDIVIKPRETIFVRTGIAMEIPTGYSGIIYSRSSVASVRGLGLANKVAVIDSDYRGEIIVPIYNHSDSVQTIEAFERIAQIVITPYIKAQFSTVDELSNTLRGEGGLGSTGKN